MFNANSMVKIIEQISSDNLDKKNLCNLRFGVVTSVSPLEILIDQKLTLRSSQLRLSSLVSNFSVEMEMQHETEDAAGPENHRHAYTGTKRFTVKLGLVPGEKVVLLREQGGQQFLVLDRVRGEM